MLLTVELLTPQDWLPVGWTLWSGRCGPTRALQCPRPRRQTSVCHTVACFCCMRTLATPGEGTVCAGVAQLCGMGLLGPLRGAGSRDWPVSPLLCCCQGPVLGPPAAHPQRALLRLSALEAPVCSGQDPPHLQPHLHHLLHPGESALPPATPLRQKGEVTAAVAQPQLRRGSLCLCGLSSVSCSVWTQRWP